MQYVYQRRLIFRVLLCLLLPLVGCTLRIEGSPGTGSSSSSDIYAFALGQSSVTSAATIAGLNSGGQMTLVGDKLVVVDSNNYRVLIWNSYSTMTSVTPADVVLGQEDKGQISYPTTPTSRNFMWPFGVTTDGTRLFVGDSSGSRILIWNTVPTVDNTPADLVLGQPDFSTIARATTASGLNYPYEIHYGGGKLLVGDYSNRRVMIWSSPITTNNQPADLVLGKLDFTTSTSGRTASIMAGPDGVWTDGTKVLVSDYSSHRILGWNTFPTVNGQAADFVLGQPNFTSGTANNGGISAATLRNAWDVKSDGNRIAVADAGNNRVLVWSNWPVGSWVAADIVLGQVDGVTRTANQGLTSPTAQTLNYPYELLFTATELLVADSGNNRISGFSLASLATNAAATKLIGQPDFASNYVSYPDGGYSASNMASPTAGASDGTHVAVADCSANRVLIWNSVPSANQPADVVIGQPNMTSITANNGGVSAQTLSCPAGVAIANGKLYVADQGNHRVLVFNQIPTSNFAFADFALGQPDLISAVANNGGVSASRMNRPSGVAVFGTKLVVNDRDNHRVLIWNTLPTASGAAADLVLGQATFIVNSANAGGVSASTMNKPSGNPWTDGTRLMITDTENHRVLMWNTWPISNGQAADVVMGQSAMNFNLGSHESYVLDVFINDSVDHQVTLYGVDWDSTSRRMRIDVLDAANNVLDSQIITTSFNPGVYLKWNVRGRIKFRVQGTAGHNGTISGIFFDPKTTGSSPSGTNGAVFVGQDTTRGGNWVGTYGSDGYKIALGDESLPTYVTSFDPTTASTHTWAGVTADTRGLQNAAATSRSATCWFADWGGKPDAKSFSSPTGVVVHEGRVFVADRWNYRLLRWNSIPATNGVAADLVIGQANNFSNESGYGEFKFYSPTGLFSASGQFYVVDDYNRRVLVYPTSKYSQF